MSKCGFFPTFHVTDPRARHFWDGGAEVQRSFSTPLGLGDSPAWDVFLVYGPGKYRFADFIKVGSGLVACSLVLIVTLVPVFWPLRLP